MSVHQENHHPSNDGEVNSDASSLGRKSSVSELEDGATETQDAPETEMHTPKTPTAQFVYESVPSQEEAPTAQPSTKGNWTWEIISILLSIGCIVAIAVVVAVLNGKPLSEWGLPIRPNSLVSIFAAISKAALIFPVAQSISQLKWLYYRQDHRALIDIQRFDDASRGPWGSILFLWHFKTRALVASCGCLITIVALAMDPFTQQIMEYPMRSVSMGNMSASTQVAHAYDTGLRGTLGAASGKCQSRWSGINADDNTSAQYVSPGMQAAVLSGIYGLSSDPPFSCPSGNCTWPAMSTLGVCSSCQNVTAATNTMCHSGTTAAIKFYCTETTPGGLSFNISSGISASPGVNWDTTLNATGVSEASAANPETANILARFAVSKEPIGSAGRVDECQIKWCVRTYTGFNVSSGTVHAGQVSTHDLEYFNMSSSRLEKRQWGKVQINFRDGSSDDLYPVNSNDVSSTGSMLAKLFTTDLTGGVSQPAGFGTSVKVDIARALYDTANVTDMVANMTQSMTNFIQSANGTTLFGEAWQNETFVEVHWPWFILPAALVFLAAVLLLVSMVVNHRQPKDDARLWKSSMLPLLFHNDMDRYELLNGGEKEASMQGTAEMDTRARELQVQLGGCASTQWKLVIAQPEVEK